MVSSSRIESSFVLKEAEPDAAAVTEDVRELHHQETRGSA